MENTIEQKISNIFNRIVINPPYSPVPIKITQFSWNQDMEDYEVIYFLDDRKLCFIIMNRLPAQ
jgi:hypothetical protein